MRNTEVTLVLHGELWAYGWVESKFPSSFLYRRGDTLWCPVRVCEERAFKSWSLPGTHCPVSFLFDQSLHAKGTWRNTGIMTIIVFRYTWTL
jgi:hypothetical protein